MHLDEALPYGASYNLSTYGNVFTANYDLAAILVKPTGISLVDLLEILNVIDRCALYIRKCIV